MTETFKREEKSFYSGKTLHTCFTYQVSRQLPSGSGEDFTRFIICMGMVAILVM